MNCLPASLLQSSPQCKAVRSELPHLPARTREQQCPSAVVAFHVDPVPPLDEQGDVRDGAELLREFQHNADDVRTSLRKHGT
jgi:hypothetical protein